MATTWEPFPHSTRRAIVRAQEVAQMFGSPAIGTQHLLFVLAEADDPLAAALVRSLDKDALKARLGTVGQAPSTEMVFSAEAKHAIECAFLHVRRLEQSSVETSHLALGILDAEPPAYVPGHDRASLGAEIDAIAIREAEAARLAAGSWHRTDVGDGGDGVVVDRMLRTLQTLAHLPPGTRVALSVVQPNGAERRYTFEREANR